MAATVTIARAYFDALLRRAEFHASDDSGGAPGTQGVHLVTIPKSEHENLLRAASEYNTLKKALFRGGISQATFDLLISEERQNPHQAEAPRDMDSAGEKQGLNTMHIALPQWCIPTPTPSEANLQNPGRQSSWQRNNGAHDFTASPSSRARDDKYTLDEGELEIQNSTSFQPAKQTLWLSNLSSRTSHKDIAEVIRGGRVLEIHLRRDKCATVSFVEGAEEFLHYAKRNDIYIHDKLISVKWSERQFFPNNYVTRQIANGSTRNLVIRGGAEKLTEEGIRSDLEHIQFLVVIDVTFKAGDAYISTNSVRRALYARTCMTSRATYRGLQMEWYPDECAGPLTPSPQRLRPMPAMVKKATPAITNPFALLNVDASESDSDEYEDASMATTFGMFNHGVRLGDWADTSVAA